MIEVSIPGFGSLRLQHLVLDYNGTLALDGELLAGVRAALDALSDRLDVHVVTADTFGKAESQLAGTRWTFKRLDERDQDTSKLEYVSRLGAESTVCIGNGRNDRRMLKKAALGISVIQQEGAAVETVNAADVVGTSILSALDLLSHPDRLKATLRS